MLDIGAGTGRSTVMVLEARPHVTAVALDLFGESFDEHFGDKGSGIERLRANLRAAGVDARATIQPGDMRHLPFEAGAFDAVLSTYAMDHLGRDDSRMAVEEAARVLKPGGDFLLMVIEKDGWLQFTFGPLLLHSGTRGADWWQQTLQAAASRWPRPAHVRRHSTSSPARRADSRSAADGPLSRRAREGAPVAWRRLRLPVVGHVRPGTPVTSLMSLRLARGDREITAERRRRSGAQELCNLLGSEPTCRRPGPNRAARRRFGWRSGDCR